MAGDALKKAFGSSYSHLRKRLRVRNGLVGFFRLVGIVQRRSEPSGKSDQSASQTHGAQSGAPIADTARDTCSDGTVTATPATRTAAIPAATYARTSASGALDNAPRSELDAASAAPAPITTAAHSNGPPSLMIRSTTLRDAALNSVRPPMSLIRLIASYARSAYTPSAANASADAG